MPVRPNYDDVVASRPPSRPAPQLDLVRLRQQWALAPIFRPLARGERGYLDVTVTVGEGTVRIVGRWALGIDDQDVLLALLRLAERVERCPQLGPQPATEVGVVLRKRLEADGEAAEQTTITVRTTPSEIARLCGRSDGGAVLAQIRQSLFALSNAMVILQHGSWWTTSHILSRSTGHPDGRVEIALHPHLAQAMLGGEAATRIDLAAHRQLRGAVARRLHVHLSGWVNPGIERRVRLDVLARRVWPEPSETPSTVRSRRERLGAALREIGQLDGWEIALTGLGGERQAIIKRASKPGSEHPRRTTRTRHKRGGRR